MTLWLAAAALAGQLTAPDLHTLVAKERGRPVVVSFWATWCEPCRKEMPALAALARKHGDAAWLSVSTDDAADRPAVDEMLRGLDLPFPVYQKAAGPDQAFIDGVDPKWSGVVPMTLVFDADGQRRTMLAGEHDPVEIERALAALNQPDATRAQP